MRREISIIKESVDKYLVKTEKTAYTASICYKKGVVEISGFGLLARYDLRDGFFSPLVSIDSIKSEDIVLIATILAEAAVDEETL